MSTINVNLILEVYPLNGLTVMSLKDSQGMLLLNSPRMSSLLDRHFSSIKKNNFNFIIIIIIIIIILGATI